MTETQDWTVRAADEKTSQTEDVLHHHSPYSGSFIQLKKIMRNEYKDELYKALYKNKFSSFTINIQLNGAF